MGNSRSQILIVEAQVAMRNTLAEVFVGYDVRFAANAQEAVAVADTASPACVITELSLAGHSGMEFLYEFRSYPEWVNVPVIVYTAIRLEDDVLRSDSWKTLEVEYAYKPDTSLERLKRKVEELISEKAHN